MSVVMSAVQLGGWPISDVGGLSFGCEHISATTYPQTSLYVIKLLFRGTFIPLFTRDFLSAMIRRYRPAPVYITKLSFQRDHKGVLL